MTESKIQLFVDGDCPLCRREVRWMQSLNNVNKVEFIDIASPDFESVDRHGQAQLMSQIHARTSDGNWVVGADAFRLVYRTLGFRSLVWLSELPLICQLINVAYRIFARYRLTITGRRRKATHSSCNMTRGNATSPYS